MCFCRFGFSCPMFWFGFFLTVCVFEERNTRYSMDSSQQTTKLIMFRSLSLSLKAIGCVHRTTSTEKGTDDASCRLSLFVSIACVVLPYWGTERVFHVARRCPVLRSFEMKNWSLRFDSKKLLKAKSWNTHTHHRPISLSLVWNCDIESHQSTKSNHQNLTL